VGVADTKEYRCEKTIDIEGVIMGLEKEDSVGVTENITRHMVGHMIDEGAYTVVTLSAMTGIPKGTLYNWKNGKQKPRKSSNEGVEKIMAIVGKQKALPRHTSYGYATDEQIEQLKKLGPSVERDMILKQIEKQTKLRGKIK